MGFQSSGAISFSDLRTQLHKNNLQSSGSLSLGDYYRHTNHSPQSIGQNLGNTARNRLIIDSSDNSNIPTSGTVSLSNYYGAITNNSWQQVHGASLSYLRFGKNQSYLDGVIHGQKHPTATTKVYCVNIALNGAVDYTAFHNNNGTYPTNMGSYMVNPAMITNSAVINTNEDYGPIPIYDCMSDYEQTSNSMYVYLNTGRTFGNDLAGQVAPTYYGASQWGSYTWSNHTDSDRHNAATIADYDYYPLQGKTFYYEDNGGTTRSLSINAAGVTNFMVITGAYAGNRNAADYRGASIWDNGTNYGVGNGSNYHNYYYTDFVQWYLTSNSQRFNPSGTRTFTIS